MRRNKHRASGPGQANSGVDLGEVERLLDFMSRHGLEEFEYAQGDLHIRLKKPAANSNSLSRAVAEPEIVVARAAAPVIGPVAAETSAPREAPSAAALAEDTHLIKSPIVGTYYESPSPGAAPFVKLGDHVAQGQVLCIIEAMKLMNEIESDLAGEIVRLFTENGQPVEYGESLFAIRPTRKK